MAFLLNLEKGVSIDIIYLLYDYIYSNMFFIRLDYNHEMSKMLVFISFQRQMMNQGVSLF
jgi:hypothetical protein